jgi:hypothetical protein
MSKHVTLTRPAIKICLNYCCELRACPSVLLCTLKRDVYNLKVGIFIDKYVSSYLIYAYIQDDSREDAKGRG